jgi:hypothetical protein
VHHVADGDDEGLRDTSVGSCEATHGLDSGVARTFDPRHVAPGPRPAASQRLADGEAAEVNSRGRRICEEYETRQQQKPVAAKFVEAMASAGAGAPVDNVNTRGGARGGYRGPKNRGRRRGGGGGGSGGSRDQQQQSSNDSGAAAGCFDVAGQVTLPVIVRRRLTSFFLPPQVRVPRQPV